MNLVLGEAIVTYDGDLISLEDIIGAIEDKGFEARPKIPAFGVVNFDIEGMTCSSCSQALESGVLEKKGVKSVAVNLIENTCRVEYDAAVIGVRDLISAIEDIGNEMK